MNTKNTPEDYVAEIKAKSDAEWKARGYTLAPPEFELKYGKKYIKVVVISFGSPAVHCFLDFDGNIYKSASWSKPAKGIRGHIDNENKPLLGRDYYR